MKATFGEALDPVFETKWKDEIKEHHKSYQEGNYEAAIRGLVSMYGWTFEELQGESTSEASKEWDFSQETADYFFLGEGFDVETGEFIV